MPYTDEDDPFDCFGGCGRVWDGVEDWWLHVTIDDDVPIKRAIVHQAMCPHCHDALERLGLSAAN